MVEKEPRGRMIAPIGKNKEKTTLPQVSTSNYLHVLLALFAFFVFSHVL
jgi:hypothetical protein